MDDLTHAVIAITREAGEAIMAYYRDRSSFSVSEKFPDNPLTDADLAADTLLRQRLTVLLPESGWLSEETADHPGRLEKEVTWVVDPLDGTKEFVLGIPEFAVSVALVEAGRPILAVVFNPPAGELYHAHQGNGAFCNGRPVRVSRRRVLQGARVDASRTERQRGEFQSFEAAVALRTVGSIAYKLARVASGRADATWSRGPKNEWDICAGSLLVQEAGGRCVDLSDRPLRFNEPRTKVNGIVADNGFLHQEIMAALLPYGPARLE